MLLERGLVGNLIIHLSLSRSLTSLLIGISARQNVELLFQSCERPFFGRVEFVFYIFRLRQQREEVEVGICHVPGPLASRRASRGAADGNTLYRSSSWKTGVRRVLWFGFIDGF